MRRLVAVLAVVAAVSAACELTLPNGDPAGVFPVGAGVHQLGTGLHQPEVVVDQSVYPDGSGPFVGVQFKINGAVDARHSARPNGVDATGPNEPGSGRFHIYPDYNFQPCDTVSARWFHEGVEWGATAQVPGASCTGTTTTTTAAPTTTTSPPTTTTQPPVGGWSQDFNGATDAVLDGFNIGLWHRDDTLVAQQSWPADHAFTTGSDCTPPGTTHTVTRSSWSDSFYVCGSVGGDPGKGHLMTAVGDTSGYSIGYFGPDQVFTRGDVTTISWDVNSTYLGTRQWWELLVQPAGQTLHDKPKVSADGTACDGACTTIGWLAGTVGVPAYGPDDLVVATGPFGSDVPKVNGTNLTWQHMCGSFALDPEGCGSKMIRRTWTVTDNLNGTVTVTFLGNTWTVPGRFPDQFTVTWKDHSYTPNKDGVPVGYAWHWDNLSVN